MIVELGKATQQTKGTSGHTFENIVRPVKLP